MTGPRRGVLKTAMEHYLYARSRTADELLGTEEVDEVSHRKRLPALAPNRLLDIPRGAKLPLLPGSSTLFRSTHLGKQNTHLYQPSSGFDLGEPFCQIMTTKYTSLHNPHLHSYYKSTDNLRRFKRGGYVTNENKKMFEKRVTKRQEPSLLPEGGDTCHFGEWLMQEESPDLHDPKGQMRNSAWKKKEMLLLLKIGDDVKRESRTEHLRRKNREEKAKKKQAKLEKKMGWGANASSRPSVNGKKILLTSMVSQQPFDQIVNNITNKKRACFQ
ncbi:unnamed protein product, partial [Lepidochelys kempii]